MSKSIYLRKLKPDDLSHIYESFDYEEILYMTGTKKTFTFKQVQKHYEKCIEDDSRYDFAICLSENDELIGDLSIVDIEEDNHKAVFRISLHRIDVAGKGYGTEAAKQAVAFAFEELKLNRLQLEVYSHNLRGYHSYKKAGFIEEGRLRQSLYMNGQYSDEVIMSVLREDYEKALR
ncbi:GNAT family N-acetyltransferase [Alkalicoccobacillus murimartini]|uniref:RimJ/RimL family protein N-acetyltransferase n=1 Tax=Alkalicoccobacillus murimartini TaxID=171685 RepID=A0ABT9YHV5_9BACI|nr:GNAT family protein [Alkalicoccobacillus murimartini]MDQ0207440.1 RimJ/RimL family protein N-acetyltransferase [Alkalicoccobacillus murimartini]